MEGHLLIFTEMTTSTQSTVFVLVQQQGLLFVFTLQVFVEAIHGEDTIYRHYASRPEEARRYDMALGHLVHVYQEWYKKHNRLRNKMQLLLCYQPHGSRVCCTFQMDCKGHFRDYRKAPFIYSKFHLILRCLYYITKFN